VHYSLNLNSFCLMVRLEE